MADNIYDPNKLYDEDVTYNITGKVLNGISGSILKLEAEVKSFEDAKMLDELAALRLRDRNPAVKDAWDQYQTVLGLAKRD